MKITHSARTRGSCERYKSHNRSRFGIAVEWENSEGALERGVLRRCEHLTLPDLPLPHLVVNDLASPNTALPDPGSRFCFSSSLQLLTTGGQHSHPPNQKLRPNSLPTACVGAASSTTIFSWICTMIRQELPNRSQARRR